jgi:hypothetical protein
MLPTPPTTTTMKESMMYPWPKDGPTLPIWLRNAPASPASPLPRPKVSMFTRSVRTPMHDAIVRFCIEARMRRPRGVLVSTSHMPKTIRMAKPITKTRFQPKMMSFTVQLPLR